MTFTVLYEDLIGKRVEGVRHTAVAVYDKEFCTLLALIVGCVICFSGQNTRDLPHVIESDRLHYIYYDMKFVLLSEGLIGKRFEGVRHTAVIIYRTARSYVRC